MTETALTPQTPKAIMAKTPMDLLQLAIEREGSIDVIERLAKLQMEVMDRDAKVAFTQAFEDFKRNVPAIVKDSAIIVNQQERGKYAKLDKICNVLIPDLLKVGITHRWKSRTSEDGKMIFVTCFLRHRLGYEEEGATLGGPPDTSGSKNAIQANGSTMAYLERYTLVAACGIAIKDQDVVDSAAPAGEVLAESVVEEYIEALHQSPDMASLRTLFAECYQKAKAIGDNAATKAFQAAYEGTKRRLL